MCDRCGFFLQGWDDGNPYLEYPEGERHFFWHPSGEAVISEVAEKILGHEPSDEEKDKVLRRYGGNAPDYICRECEGESRIDPNKDGLRCSHCQSASVEELYGLEGKQCLKCDGHFGEGHMTSVY